MRTGLTTLLIVLSLHSISRAQTLAHSAIQPSPTLHLPLPTGSIHYVLTFSSLLETGSAIQDAPSYLTNISGDLSYQSQSTKHPFNILYAGGWGTSTDPYLPPTVFQNLTLMQGLIAGKWSMNASNSFSYLPYAPTAGLSGIPGIGDLGFQTGEPAAAHTPTVLTNYATIISDSLSGNITRQLDYDTYLTGSTTWGQERFLSGAGLTTNELIGSVGLNRRLNARSSIAATYAYSNYTYSSSGFSFTTQGANILGRHQWTRALSTTASIGPQWIRSSNATAVPQRLALAASASVTYSRRATFAEVTYTRGSVSGFGVLPGAFSTSIQTELQQALTRKWMASLSGTFITVAGLGVTNGTPTNVDSTGAGTAGYASMQVTHTLGRSFTAYLSYTFESQSVDQPLQARNALNGMSQIIATGISFRPHSKDLGGS